MPVSPPQLLSVCRAGRDGMGGPWFSFPGFRIDDWTAVPSLLPGLERFKPPQALRRPRKVATSLSSLPTTDFCSRGRLPTSISPFARPFLPGLRFSSLTYTTTATHDIRFSFWVFVGFSTPSSSRSILRPAIVLSSRLLDTFNHHTTTDFCSRHSFRPLLQRAFPAESLPSPSNLLADISLWQTIFEAWLSHIRTISNSNHLARVSSWAISWFFPVESHSIIPCFRLSGPFVTMVGIRSFALLSLAAFASAQSMESLDPCGVSLSQSLRVVLETGHG